MKTTPGAIILEEQEGYLESLLRDRDPLLAEMEQYSAAHNIPSSDPEVALFLAISVVATSARRILEIGTAIGYGAIAMARAGGPEGKVTTIDVSPDRARIAQQFIDRAGLSERIEILLAKALDALSTLTGPFDLAYIDAVKEEYVAYLELIVPLLRPGGLIIADNVLWKGQAATGRLLAPDQRESTRSIQQFNQRFMTHPSLQSVIIPLGDGLAYGVKI